MRRHWSKDIIVKIIQDRHRRSLPINSNHIQTKCKRLYHSANKYFGGWRQAVETAGIDYSQIRLKPPSVKWTKTKVMSEIRKRKREGKPINVTSIAEQDRSLYRATTKYFPSPGCKNAIIAAGFDPQEESPKVIWPKRRVKREILRHRRRGLPLYGHWMRRHGYNKLLAAGNNRFGSWKKAIKSAGISYSSVKGCKNRWWTRNRIIAFIKVFKKRNKPLNSIYIQGHHNRIFGASLVYFGSWGKAVEAAGYDYLEHCKVWSSKAWIRKLTSEDVKTIDKQALQMSGVRRVS